jgi:hypothetical protein
MAVTRPAPWWLGWLLVGGLALLFVGERVLPGVGLARALFSGLGAAAVLASVAWRAMSCRAATGEARRVERMLLLAYAGCALALVLYLISSDDGIRWLDIDFAEADARDRYQVVGQVLWITLLTVALGPALGGQLALGRHRQARADAAGVESFRVLETATAGLAVALGAALLVVVGYVASIKDETLDLSYFKTATPGPSTVAMFAGLEEPLRVLLFFPPVNPVKDEAIGYFRELADATGRVQIEEYDRLENPTLANEYEIQQDGAIIMLRGDQESRLDLSADLAQARPLLRSLDRRFQNALLPLLRRRRSVYLTTGHGEINDTLNAPGTEEGLGGTTAFREIINYLGYDPIEFGLTRGLGNDVPVDAAMVAVLGPRRPFLAEEMAALERHVARGGSILLALDPGTEFRMSGDLVTRIGVRWFDEPLANEEAHMQQRGDDSDRRLIVTDRFSSHEASTSLARAGDGAGVMFVGPARLEGTGPGGTPAVALVRALPSTFVDLNNNFRYDEDSERQDSYILATASEPVGDSGTAARAIVMASSSTFSDAVLMSLGGNAALVADGMRWLGREENLSGPIGSEEDIAIVHTQAEDVFWFHTIIFGAPALMLGLGLLGVFRRRRRRAFA